MDKNDDSDFGSYPTRNWLYHDRLPFMEVWRMSKPKEDVDTEKELLEQMRALIRATSGPCTMLHSEIEKAEKLIAEIEGVKAPIRS